MADKRNELERRLTRLGNMRDDLELKHSGNEQNYTYHGGFELGYIKGKIAEIETQLENYDEQTEKPCSETCKDV
jgi:hypothetical protein